MKKPMFIIRFGTPIFHEIDQEVISKISDEDLDKSVGSPCPIGFVALVMTECDASEIANLYHSTAGKSGQQISMAVWPLDSPDTRALLPFHNMISLVADFKRMHNLNDDAQAADDSNECTLSLNDLLDKINESGKESLTANEFSRLKFLSNVN